MKSITSETAASLIAEINDISLIIDSDGTIVDVALGNDDEGLAEATGWIGQKWIDTVTKESRTKISKLLNPELGATGSKWRQVNHPRPGSPDLPIIYKTLTYNEDLIVAVGRDLRPMAQLQQQLLDAQHSLESDYARLHHAETRYRMLFNMASEAILIVDAETLKVVEANPAAGRLLDRPPEKLVNRAFPRGFSESSLDAIDELLLRVRAAGRVDSINVQTARSGKRVRLGATLIRREDGPFFLIRISVPGQESDQSASSKVLDVVNRSTDCFVVVNPEGQVLAANRAFLETCQLATELQVVGQMLDQWLGRPGVDVSLLIRNLRERGQVRQFSTTLQPEFGARIDVELSAVSALDSDEPCFGFVIRRSAQRPRPTGDSAAVPASRSMAEIKDLVGQVPLKDLVRETTDIVERMCIEAALNLTNDSRASAADLLGLSRQSLYVKLRRYGIGDSNKDKD